MPEIRQMKCFVVCADVGSFSEAAKILFTTQSNVSKIVSSLETELNVKLFYRNARGISLTKQGQKVYRSAEQILKSMEDLENISYFSGEDRFYVSTNPSSWFADRFVEFYNAHSHQDYHYHIKAASSDEIMKRVMESKDEIGFIYIFDVEREAVRYHLQRNNLEFVELTKVGGQLYLGKTHPLYQKEELTTKDLQQLRFVQMYQDYYSQKMNWEFASDESLRLGHMDVSVVTNSDYIMQAMLEGTDIANVSAMDFAKNSRNKEKGILLAGENGMSAYGFIKRNGEPLSPVAEEFVAFIKESLFG